MIHIISSTSNPRIITPTLPNKLQNIINTRKHIVHKHDGIEKLVMRVPQFVQRHKSSIAHFSKVLNPMIEIPARAFGRSDRHAHSG
jgi:hypothetical protein